MLYLQRTGTVQDTKQYGPAPHFVFDITRTDITAAARSNFSRNPCLQAVCYISGIYQVLEYILGSCVLYTGCVLL